MGPCSCGSVVVAPHKLEARQIVNDTEIFLKVRCCPGIGWAFCQLFQLRNASETSKWKMTLANIPLRNRSNPIISSTVRVNINSLVPHVTYERSEWSVLTTVTGVPLPQGNSRVCIWTPEVGQKSKSKIKIK